MTSPVITIFVCDDPEAAWHLDLAEQSAADWAEHEHELDIEDAAALHTHEPDIFMAREGVDPHWPPPELDRFEMVGPEIISGKS